MSNRLPVATRITDYQLLIPLFPSFLICVIRVIRGHVMSVPTKDAMSKIVGIDLGTTNSLVAIVDSGIPLVIADSEGHRLTPSVVHFPATGEGPLVGAAANRMRALKPAETAYSVKRFIGRRGADIAREELLVTYPLAGSGPGPVTIELSGRSFTPEEISAEV